AASDKKVDADASSIPLESPSHPASLPRGMVKITICINLCPRRLKFINILQNDIKTLNFIHVINESPDYFNYGDVLRYIFIISPKDRVLELRALRMLATNDNI
ncbi:18848_t:CDS:2, partial [Funneliformis geosporum]